MKYSKQYAEAKTKEEFIQKLISIGVIKKTASRRWYEYNNNVVRKRTRDIPYRVIPPSPEAIDVDNTDRYREDKKHPLTHLKSLMVEDMKRYNMKLTPELLRQNGFSEYEINYLIDLKVVQVKNGKQADRVQETM